MIDGGDQIAKTAGSNYYFSPEACRGSNYKGKPNDLWAIGITMYQLAYKKLPFVSNNFPDLFRKIIEDPPVFHERE